MLNIMIQEVHQILLFQRLLILNQSSDNDFVNITWMLTNNWIDLKTGWQVTRRPMEITRYAIAIYDTNQAKVSNNESQV